LAIDRDKVQQAAQKFLEKKKYDKAILEFQKLVAADPSDARTLLKIGDAQVKMMAYGEAVVTYESVGRLYAQQGFALKAIAVYKQIREILTKFVPQLEDRYGHIAPRLAELYTQLGLISDALAALDEYATRLQNQQRDREAIAVFQKIVELDRQNPLPHLRLAEALSRSGNVDGAVVEFGIAAAELLKLGRRDDALKVLERSLHHKNDEDQARSAAEIYIGRATQQDGLRALAKLQACFQANPKHLPTLSLLARAFNLIGQAQKAIEVQKEMARIARDTGDEVQLRELATKLMMLAPNDETVRRLAMQAGLFEAPQTDSQRDPNARAPGANESAAARHSGPTSAAHPPSSADGAPRRQAAGFAPPPPPPPPPPPRSTRAAVEPEDVDEFDEVDADEVEENTAAVSQRAVPQRAVPPQPTSGIPAPARMGHSGTAAHGAAPMPPRPSPATVAPPTVEQMLKDAATFRRVRLYAKALAVLEEAHTAFAGRADVHELERDIALEANQVPVAIEAMLRLAALHVDELDSEAAALSLQDVLAYDRRHARALAMLTELGYEVVEEDDAGSEPSYDAGSDVEIETREATAAPHHSRESGDSGAERRLPSFSVPDDEPLAHSAPFANASAMELSDPFDVNAPPVRPSGDLTTRVLDASSSGPVAQLTAEVLPVELPSFPVNDRRPDAAEQAGSQPRQGNVTSAAVRGDATVEVEYADDYEGLNSSTGAQATASVFAATNTSGVPLRQPTNARGASVPAPARHPSLRAPELDLEEALEEIDFFISRGITEDARALLEEQLNRSPNNRLLLERWAELEELEHANGTSGNTQSAGDLYDLDAGSFDNFVPQSRVGDPTEQVDVEEVFAAFKEGVAKQLSGDDFQAHYDLGLAYKEMGLTDDAVRELEIAAADPRRVCVCKSMIGQIELARGRIDAALTAFLAGIRSSHIKSDQEVVLAYDIGDLYEREGQFREAYSYYQIARRLNPHHRDIEVRFQRTMAHAGSMRAPPQNQGTDDDVDRALDDLLMK
jgi:tetratricopeptide (TPR) repeat protein